MHTTYSAITILQGDDITLLCRPSELDVALQWFYNGSVISNSPHFQFAPLLLNHYLTIFHANGTNSGNYVCAFTLKDKIIDQKSIVLTVAPSECSHCACKFDNLQHFTYICSHSMFVSFF